jgi:uncharacterized membrane protein
MNKKRLENLADGIFSIVLTLVAIDIKPEAFNEVAKNITFQSLWDFRSIFLSYVLSFAVLYLYWRSHHYLISVFTGNINSILVNLNGLYFMFISLIPFSSRYLAEAPKSKTSLVIFGGHIVLIGITLLSMRLYIKNSKHIKDIFTEHDKARSLIQIAIQPIFAIFGILSTFLDPSIAWFCYTTPIIFNLIPGSVSWLEKFIFKIEKYTI